MKDKLGVLHESNTPSLWSRVTFVMLILYVILHARITSQKTKFGIFKAMDFTSRQLTTMGSTTPVVLLGAVLTNRKGRSIIDPRGNRIREGRKRNMKAIRRIAAFCLVIAVALSCAACGGKEKTVTLRGDWSQDMGLPATDTITLIAKGDLVKTMKQTLEIDLSGVDEDARKTVIATFDRLIVDSAKEIKGVDCSSSVRDGKYIFTLTMRCSGDTVKEAIAAGVINLDSAEEQISLSKTQASLEADGYLIME